MNSQLYELLTLIRERVQYGISTAELDNLLSQAIKLAKEEANETAQAHR